MEQSSCSNFHFIQAIKGGFVVKMENINSNGKPALLLKKLTDIYETENCKHSKAPPVLNSPYKCAGSGLGFSSIKRKTLCLPFVDRTVLEIDQETNDSVCHGDDDEVDTDADDKMTLRQLKVMHNKHDDDDDGIGSDEDDKMSLRQLKDRHKKHGDDEVGSGTGDKMTMGKLKDRCKSKKRELTSHPDTILEHQDANFPSDEDDVPSDEDDDLKVHLSFLKSKLTKSSKAKMRCINNDLFAFPKTFISVKTEQVLVSDVPMQLKEDSPLFSNIKAEIPEPELSGNQRLNLLVDCSLSEVPMLLKEHSPPLMKVKTETSEPKSFGQKSTKAFTGHSSISCHEESSSAEVTSSKVPETIESQHKTLMFGEEQQGCMLNEMSYEHLEYFEPKAFPKTCGDRHANNPKRSFETEVDMQSHRHGGFLETISPVRDKNLDVHSNQHEFAGQRSWNFGSYVSDTIIANKVGCTDLYDGDDICMSEDEVAYTNLGSHVSGTVLTNKAGCTNLYGGDEICMPKDKVKEELYSNQQYGSTICPLKKCVSSRDSHSCSNTDNDLESVEDRTIYEDKISNCCLSDPANSCSNPGNAFIGKFQMVEGKPPPKSPSMDDEKFSTLRSQPCHLAGMKSTSELRQLPERLLLKRKAISPSSREQLCLAMNSADLPNDLDNYKCKEKLLFAEYTKSKHPSENPCMSSSSIDENSKVSAQVCQEKVIIGPNEIAKRLKNRRKGSPPDGNLEGPHLSRSLPQFSTGCTSVQLFSAIAIAFSERQMHDIESLAVKLLNDLKSMKDIVEGKLLFEACSSTSLKNEADKVRVAIKNANKVEGQARKWLSMMNRDCTRFCKLMKMTQDGAAPSKDTVHKERKITFADEAGGMLCHVNYFSNAMTSKQSDDGKQED